MSTEWKDLQNFALVVKDNFAEWKNQLKSVR